MRAIQAGLKAQLLLGEVPFFPVLTKGLSEGKVVRADFAFPA
ncbi:hypothetical protein [Pseudomonas sp. MWU12-2323]|nr:hypothetical protein [Pseudomonas sp. MWU12-2323]